MRLTLLALLLLCGSAAAEVLTIPFTPPAATNVQCPCNKTWEDTFDVPQFNPALGVLTNVEVEILIQDAGYAGGSAYAENVSNHVVVSPEASLGFCTLMRFADDRSWVYGAAQAFWYGSIIGRPGALGDSFQYARYLAPFDGALDWAGPSAGSLCVPGCGPLRPVTTIWEFQRPRFVGAGVVKLLWQPRKMWWANRAAEQLRWAMNLPVVPLVGEVRYTYTPH